MNRPTWEERLRLQGFIANVYAYAYAGLFVLVVAYLIFVALVAVLFRLGWVHA